MKALMLVLALVLTAACPKDDETSSAGGSSSRGGTGGGGRGGDVGRAGSCTSDSDCRLFDDYCQGCSCRALAKADPDPVCPGAAVACLVAPCRGRSALCRSGTCVATSATLSR